MKLRLILTVLLALALTFLGVGGVGYYRWMTAAVMNESVARISDEAIVVRNAIAAHVAGNSKVAELLAGIDSIADALTYDSPEWIAEADRTLDYFAVTGGYDVCYLMNTNGLTIAATNRNAPQSFVGKNYGFRPYFQNAIRGHPWRYMAIGVTSGTRGVYYSHPVYVGEAAVPLGVVVIKAPIDQMESRISAAGAGDWALADPSGLLFASSRSDWRGQLLNRLDADQMAALAASRQFGKGPWGWIGMKMEGEGSTASHGDTTYLVHKTPLAVQPGWAVYLFQHSADALAILGPLMDYRRYALMTACVVFAALLLTLYFMARADLVARARAKQAMHRQNAYLEALHETTLGVMSRLNFNDLVESLLSRAAALVNADSGFLFVYDDATDEMEMRVGVGHFATALGTRLTRGQGLAGKVWETRNVLMVDDYAGWTDRVLTVGFEGLHCLLGVPITSGGRIRGVMGVGHFDTEACFEDQQQRIIERFAQLAGIAMENARLYALAQTELDQRRDTEQALMRANSRLKELAALDGLTRVANRRQFDEHLPLAWRRQMRQQAPLAMLMCDIDYFKRYNDTHGHPAGDDILKQVAAAIAGEMKRPGDLVARYGGEEFAVLLSGTDTEGARTVAKAITGRIRALNISHGDSPIGGILTISIGVASMTPDRGSDPKRLIHAADQALYMAKDQGRNRICTAPPKNAAPAA